MTVEVPALPNEWEDSPLCRSAAFLPLGCLALAFREYSVFKSRIYNYIDVDNSVAGITLRPKCGVHLYYSSCTPCFPNNWKPWTSVKLGLPSIKMMIKTA